MRTRATHSKCRKGRNWLVRFRLTDSSTFSSVRKATMKNGVIAMMTTKTMTTCHCRPTTFLRKMFGIGDSALLRLLDDTFVVVLINWAEEDAEITIDCAVW